LLFKHKADAKHGKTYKVLEERNLNVPLKKSLEKAFRKVFPRSNHLAKLKLVSSAPP